MNHPVIAVIGAGNMGSSLINGLIKNGHPADKLWASNPSEEKLAKLKQCLHIQTTTDNVEAAQTADVILFAIKPQRFAGVAENLKPIVQAHRPLVISVAAGIREKSIRDWLGGNIPIVRAMPNTPSLIGCGATALYANTCVNEKQRNLAESILRSVGIVVWLDDEAQMDVVTGLSGSGPAYFFLIMEALQKSAEQFGLPSDTARLLALQTASGASRMAIESGKSLEELRQHVTSPGGTTEQAIAVLEKNNIAMIFQQALQAAKKRSEELAELLGKV